MRQLTPGKQKGLESISDENGIVLATAMDQRGSLGKMINSLNPEISYEDGLTRFKKGVSEILGNRSSSLLLDPEYGWEAAEKLNKDIGLIMAYEKTGYDTESKGRLPSLVDHYAVSDLVEKGVHALKLLVYYDPDEEEEYNSIKKTFIKRVGDECRQNDLLFILEPVSYSAKGLPAKSPEFAKEKPWIIEYFMEEFSKECYGVDLLKVEVPVAIHYIEGYAGNANSLFSADEAARLYFQCSEKSKVPFIYLSGGVSNKQFIDTLYFAKKAQSRFCGCLCGRAIWQEGVKPFAEEGEKAFYHWLETEGVANLNNVVHAIHETATPWRDSM
ncbi:MAG: tagatose 1,6-diphosphate aldolase [Thermoactinomyces sp.]